MPLILYFIDFLIVLLQGLFSGSRFFFVNENFILKNLWSSRTNSVARKKSEKQLRLQLCIFSWKKNRKRIGINVLTVLNDVYE